MERFFGCHVSAAGGLANAARNGARLCVNTIQIHPTQPQRWNFKPFAPGTEDAFLSAKAGSGIKKVFLHGVYLINLAIADSVRLGHAVRSLRYYLDLADRIGSEGIIFHVGSNKDQPTEQAGFRQSAEAIDKVLDGSAGTAKLILEVSAGSGKIIGDRMEELRAIYDLVNDKSRVAFALDTQHMWASGYDLATSLDEVTGQIEHIFGFDRVAAIHLNDSKTDLGSRVDRHENLGCGRIGLDALARFVHHPKLQPIPMMLETPGLKDPETAAAEVEALRRLIGSD